MKPSRPATEVVSATNAAAAKLASEVVLLLRVGERPRAGLDPPPDPDNESIRAYCGAAGSSLAAADFRIRDIVDQRQAC